MANNQIRDISGLATLDALQDLDLYFNNISDISPLANLTALTRLQLESNPLNDDAYDVYIPEIANKNTGISLQYDERKRPALTVYSTIGGSVTTPGEGVFTYDRDDSVLLKAEATSGFSFVGWSGSFNLHTNPFSFTIERDLEICAHFLSTLDVIYVDDNAPEDAGPNDSTIGDPAEDGTPGHPFDSIQKAIDVAGRDVTIVVRPGTYYETIDLLARASR